MWCGPTYTRRLEKYLPDKGTKLQHNNRKNASVIEEVIDNHLFFLPGENQLVFLKVSSDDLVRSKIDGVDIDAIFWRKIACSNVRVEQFGINASKAVLDAARNSIAIKGNNSICGNQSEIMYSKLFVIAVSTFLFLMCVLCGIIEKRFAC